jgi:hypothetical protein
MNGPQAACPHPPGVQSRIRFTRDPDDWLAKGRTKSSTRRSAVVVALEDGLGILEADGRGAVFMDHPQHMASGPEHPTDAVLHRAQLLPFSGDARVGDERTHRREALVARDPDILEIQSDRVSAE